MVPISETLSSPKFVCHLFALFLWVPSISANTSLFVNTPLNWLRQFQEPGTVHIQVIHFSLPQAHKYKHTLAHMPCVHTRALTHVGLELWGKWVASIWPGEQVKLGDSSRLPEASLAPLVFPKQICIDLRLPLLIGLATLVSNPCPGCSLCLLVSFYLFGCLCVLSWNQRSYTIMLGLGLESPSMECVSLESRAPLPLILQLLDRNSGSNS